MQTKPNFVTIFIVALATAVLVFGFAASSEAGWYKKANKAAKKATKQVEKIGHNVEKEVRTGGVAHTIEKGKSDISREYKEPRATYREKPSAFTVTHFVKYRNFTMT